MSEIDIQRMRKERKECNYKEVLNRDREPSPRLVTVTLVRSPGVGGATSLFSGHKVATACSYSCRGPTRASPDTNRTTVRQMTAARALELRVQLGPGLGTRPARGRIPGPSARRERTRRPRRTGRHRDGPVDGSESRRRRPSNWRSEPGSTSPSGMSAGRLCSRRAKRATGRALSGKCPPGAPDPERGTQCQT